MNVIMFGVSDKLNYFSLLLGFSSISRFKVLYRLSKHQGFVCALVTLTDMDWTQGDTVVHDN